MRQDPLEAYALRPLTQGGLFGVFLATCAIEGALDVLHAGVGCKGKTQRLLVEHDWGRESHTQLGWTELGEAEWIHDAAEPLVRNGIELCRRRNPQLMIVSASSAVELTGVDLACAVARLRAAVPCPVAFVPHAGDAPDLWSGYAAVLAAVLELVPWGEPMAERHTVSFFGHFFHRHELDQAANLVELRRLLESLGLALGPVFLGGEPPSSLLRAHRSDLLVRLPYAGTSARELAERTRRKVLDGPLPLGLTATSRWLRAMGRLLALDAALVDRLVEREEKKTRPRLELARRALAGRRLAVLADSPSAAAWCGLGLELGLRPCLVALLDRSLGGETAFEHLLGSAGHARPPGLTVLQAPSLRRLRGSLEALAEPPELVVRPDLSLRGSPWEALPSVETGYPAPHHHAIYPMPEFGYAGAVAQAQRLLDAWHRIH
ncbi:MAG TPA: nitrogenase component 1 [Myxococcota bacterium]|nr:nitrogenase component 1 [Myxococcota bacterium]HRY94058.1 nitrogenase component 1 [Myxococcota bacterium]HSA21363.1 nitrogenase component 1 [Myxococcota bacterium]